MTDLPINYFKCPACNGKMKDVTEELELKWDSLQCLQCGETFVPNYVRGFWAGYAKGRKD